MCKCHRAWGIVLVFAGALFAANALVSGSHAFGGGWTAVVGMCVCGAVMAAAGVTALRRGGSRGQQGTRVDPPDESAPAGDSGSRED